MRGTAGWERSDAPGGVVAWAWSSGGSRPRRVFFVARKVLGWGTCHGRRTRRPYIQWESGRFAGEVVSAGAFPRRGTTPPYELPGTSRFIFYVPAGCRGGLQAARGRSWRQWGFTGRRSLPGRCRAGLYPAVGVCLARKVPGRCRVPGQPIFGAGRTACDPPDLLSIIYYLLSIL